MLCNREYAFSNKETKSFDKKRKPKKKLTSWERFKRLTNYDNPASGNSSSKQVNQEGPDEQFSDQVDDWLDSRDKRKQAMTNNHSLEDSYDCFTNKSENFRAFVQERESFIKEAHKCGSTFYLDASLEPAKIEQAYLMYIRAKQAPMLGFGVNGRLQIGDEEAEARNDPSLLVPSDELYPCIDEAMQKNLLLMDDNFKEKKDGSIFHYPNKDWTFLINDAWLLGSVHAKTELHFASPLRWDNFWVAHEDRMSTMARELIGLTACGYELRKLDQNLEIVAICVDDKKADNASLLTLKEEVQKYQNPEHLKVFFQSLPDSVKAKELSEQKKIQLLKRILPIVAMSQERKKNSRVEQHYLVVELKNVDQIELK